MRWFAVLAAFVSGSAGAGQNASNSSDYPPRAGFTEESDTVGEQGGPNDPGARKKKKWYNPTRWTDAAAEGVKSLDTRKANERSLMSNGLMMMGIESIFGGNCILRLLITNAFSAHSFGEDDYGYFPRGCGSMFGGHDQGSGYGGGGGLFVELESKFGEAEEAAKR